MKWIDSINAFFGKTISWLSVVLIAVIIVDVLLRYFFNVTSAGSMELEWHLFAAVFLLSAGWTLKEDRHVRVDLFYQGLNDRQKAMINLIGSLFFLLPFCWVGFTESLSFVESSFAVRETSPDPGGLPARYVIKGTIPVSFFLLGLQSLSLSLRSFKLLISV